MSAELAKLIKYPADAEGDCCSIYDHHQTDWLTVPDLESKSPRLKLLALSLDALPDATCKSHLEAIRLVQEPEIGIQAVFRLASPPIIINQHGQRDLDIQRVFSHNRSQPEIADFYQPDYRTTPSFYELKPSPLYPFTTASEIDFLAHNLTSPLLEVIEHALVSSIVARPFPVFSRDYFLNNDNLDPIIAEDSTRVLVFAKLSPVLPPLNQVIEQAAENGLDENKLRGYRILRDHFAKKIRNYKQLS